jgi:MYXO-CTERM domain-containing protein
MPISSGHFIRVALSACLLLAVAPEAGAHSLLVTPKPRDQQDGYKDPPRAPPGTGAPCGIGRSVPPQPQTSFQPGAKLTVQWTETINHPGCFVIDFAQANDANFQILGTKGHTGTGAPQAWSLDVTLPNGPCTGCTLRLRQLMLNADLPATACPPAVIPSGDTYYSCANVTIGSGTGGSGAGGASSSAGGASAAGRGGAVGVAGAVGTSGGAPGSAAGAPAAAGMDSAGGGIPAASGNGSGGAGAPAVGGASTSNGNGGTFGTSVTGSAGAGDGASKGGVAPSDGASAAPPGSADPQSGGCSVASPGSSAPTGLALLAALAATAFARRRRASNRESQ